MKTCLDLLEAAAPTRRERPAGRGFGPPDIERECGIRRRSLHHGDLAFDQFFMVRPVPEPRSTPRRCRAVSVRRRLPSGGGVMGIAGRNAARQVLASGDARALPA